MHRAFDTSILLLLVQRNSFIVNCGESIRVHCRVNAHSVSVEKDTIIQKNVNSSMFHNYFLLK